MAYRKTSRARTTRRAARPARRVARRSGARRGAAPKRQQTVRIVIQHESANASANPGGLDMPQVQTQSKKAKF